MRGEGIRETKEKISKLRPDNDLLTNLLLTVTCPKRLDRVPPSANQPLTLINTMACSHACRCVQIN